MSRSIFAQDGFAWYFHMVLGVVSKLKYYLNKQSFSGAKAPLHSKFSNTKCCINCQSLQSMKVSLLNVHLVTVGLYCRLYHWIWIFSLPKWIDLSEIKRNLDNNSGFKAGPRIIGKGKNLAGSRSVIGPLWPILNSYWLKMTTREVLCSLHGVVTEKKIIKSS